MMPNDDRLSQLALLTHQLRDAWSEDLQEHPEGSLWKGHCQRFQELTGTARRDAFADGVAQSITCFGFAHRAYQQYLQGLPVFAWLMAAVDPLESDVLALCLAQNGYRIDFPRAEPILVQIDDCIEVICHETTLQPPSDQTTSTEGIVYFYERFLAAYNRHAKRARGVFYTPHELVSFIIHRTDQMLCDEFSLPAGLADTSTWRKSLEISRRARHLASSSTLHLSDFSILPWAQVCSYWKRPP